MNMKKHAKITALLAGFVLMTLTVAACRSGESAPPPSSTAKGTAAASTASPASEGPKPTISISAFDRGAVPAGEGSYEQNRWTEWINEQSPVQVDWIPVDRGQAQQKLSTLIASGSAPDLIWEYDRNYIAQLANQGAIQPIGDYIEKYSTTYKQYLADNPELKAAMTINGEIYAVTSKRSVESIANHGIWIRQDWLDKLQLEAPTTVEELIEVARKFKEEDPDGNGKADSVPIVFNGNVVQIMRAFFFTNENQWYLEDGQLKYARTLDRYKDSLAFQKSLFDEGLIDREYITDSNFQRARQLWTTGQAGIYFGSWAMDNEIRDLKTNVPDAVAAPLEPVEGPYGKNGLYQELPANVLTAFNSDMDEKQVEAAMKFLDWLLEEGWFGLRFGEENVHYSLVDGKIPQRLDADKFRQEVAYANEYAILSQWAMQPEWIPVMAAQDALSQEIALAKSEALKVALKNEYRRDIAFSPDLPEVSQLIATFHPIATQIEVKVVTGGDALTPEEGLEQVRKEWNRLGGENVEQLAQQWYEANKEFLK